MTIEYGDDGLPVDWVGPLPEKDHKKADVIYATAILTSLDACPACGWIKPECMHMGALRRLVFAARVESRTGGGE